MNCPMCCGPIVPHLENQWGETIFSMTYGVEAVIPLESGFPTLRIDKFNVEKNNCLLLDSLDMVEERREVATVKMTYY